MNDIEFHRLLAEKLVEEAMEYRLNPSLEELSDLFTVFHALLRLQYPEEEGMRRLQEAMGNKAQTHGMFLDRLVMTIEEDG